MDAITRALQGRKGRRERGMRKDEFPIVDKLVKDSVNEVLDKIRAKIEQSYCVVNNDYDHGRNYGLYMATQIIDMYKAESEVQE